MTAIRRSRSISCELVLVGLVSGAVLCWAVTGHAYEQRFNCGSDDDYLATDGTLFEGDRAYVAGDAGYIGGWAFWSWQAVSGTDDQDLYQFTRNTHTEYRFDLPNGHYLLTLYLSDNHEHSTGENRFDVTVEGVERLDDLDVYERVWRTHAIDFVLDVEVLDGQLNVEFAPTIGFVSTNGISVVSRDPDGVAPATPTSLEAFDSYGSAMLRWAPGAEDDLAGYVVERAAAAGGPFTPLSAPGGDIERVPWRIDPAAAGTTWYYRVRAVDAYGNQSAPSAVVSATSRQHAESTLPLVEVLIDPANLEILDDNPGSDDFVPCLVQFDNNDLFTDATCRYRGNVTRGVVKKSWKVMLGSGTWAGRDNFNINAEYYDPTLMRERISYELLTRNGAMTPQTRYVHMIVNGEWRGAYADIENINTAFLDRVGLEADLATMYKIGDNLVILPTEQDYRDAYEKELGDPNDYSDLIDFIVGLNTTPSNQRFNWFASKIDLNRFFDFYSTEIVVQNMDITFKNWFLHHDLTTDVWTTIPWDVDLTFGIVWPDPESFFTTGSIYSGAGNQLLAVVTQIPVLEQLHFDRIRQIFATTFTEAGMAALIDSTHAEVADDGERDWWKWGRTSSELFLDGPDQLKTFVTGRRAYVEGEIATLENPSDLCINELMASNATTVPDEWGEFDDWVEILNRGSAPVSLSGLYLTDELSNPGRMALPDTVLSPGEMLLIWCDNQPAQGPLHAPFKLERSGEAAGIFAGPLPTDQPIDIRPYDPQYTDASLGRLPDGSPYWQILPTPTAGAANVGGGNIRPQIRDVFHFPPTPGTGDPVVVTARIFDDGTITTAEMFYDAGGGFVSLPMADDGMSGDGAAGDDVYGATIPGQPVPGAVLYYLRAVDDLAAVTFDPTDAPATTYSYTVGYTAPPLYLNEYMAANDTTIADEWGDFDDWVEIYNAGPVTIDLLGMHLTDDLTNPTKFSLPFVNIGPGDFLLIWCDGEPLEGPLHAPFKLDRDGEELGLFDTSALGAGLIDTTRFGYQASDVSMGRVPDGGTWQIMAAPTPGTSNNPIAVDDRGAPPPALRLARPYPNPFRPPTQVRFELPAAARVAIRVIDVQGRHVRLLAERRLAAGRHQVTWDGRDDQGRRLPSGVYWIRLVSPAGSRVARAVLVR